MHPARHPVNFKKEFNLNVSMQMPCNQFEPGNIVLKIHFVEEEKKVTTEDQ